VRCLCGRRLLEVDPTAHEVCKGCDMYPWNCHCQPLAKAAERPVADVLDEDEEEF
jgi:hypothetical protein